MTAAHKLVLLTDFKILQEFPDTDCLILPDFDEDTVREAIHKKVTKLRTLSVAPLAPPPPHIRTLMGVFFLKARTDDLRHLAKKARMLPFLGEPILFIKNS